MKFEALVELSREAEGNESQVSEAKRVETCWTNYTRDFWTRLHRNSTSNRTATPDAPFGI